MSRLFDGVDDSLSVNTAAITGYPFTMACWFYSTSATTAQNLMSVVDKDTNNQRHDLALRGDVGGTPVRGLHQDASPTTQSEDTTAGYTTNTWQHACLTGTSATSRSVYLNGANKATGTTTATPINLDRTSIGRTMRQTPVQPMAGRIAEAAIWDAALTDAEVAALAKGASPLNIRPGNLVFYAPIVGNDSPSRDIAGGLSLTVTGATKADHPPIGAFRGARFAFGVPSTTAVSETPAPGGATANGTVPAPRAATTGGGATADGTTPTTKTTAAADGGTAGGTGPSAAVVGTTGGALAGGIGPSQATATADTGGALADGTGPATAATAPVGGATANGTEPVAVTVTITAGGALAGGVAPTEQTDDEEPASGPYTPTGILATSISRLGVFMLAHVPAAPVVPGRAWTYDRTANATYGGTADWTYDGAPDWTYEPVTG